VEHTAAAVDIARALAAEDTAVVGTAVAGSEALPGAVVAETAVVGTAHIAERNTWLQITSSLLVT
jgi:hypothetical protein